MPRRSACSSSLRCWRASQAANPLQALHAGNLADYWTALEGVSHFRLPGLERRP